MAESPLDRLKRLAAEKKLAAAAQPVAPVVNVQAETASAEGGASVAVVVISEEPNNESERVGSVTNRNSQAVVLNSEPRQLSVQPDVLGSESGSIPTEMGLSAEPSSQLDSANSGSSNLSTHPLAMQFAELEAALLAQQPEFKTILRQIHRHLGQEPELVTKMTEQEIQLIVSGLVVFANAEIVAPAVAKSTKAKIAAAKKVPISADDL
jgi:hypothetical protein